MLITEAGWVKGVTSPGFRGNEATCPHFVLLLQVRVGVPGCSLLLAFGGNPPNASVAGWGGRQDAVGTRSTYHTGPGDHQVPVRSWVIDPPKAPAGLTFSPAIRVSSPPSPHPQSHPPDLPAGMKKVSLIFKSQFIPQMLGPQHSKLFLLSYHICLPLEREGQG